jgi:hypothetical protein
MAFLYVFINKITVAYRGNTYQGLLEIKVKDMLSTNN